MIQAAPSDPVDIFCSPFEFLTQVSDSSFVGVMFKNRLFEIRCYFISSPNDAPFLGGVDSWWLRYIAAVSAEVGLGSGITVNVKLGEKI